MRFGKTISSRSSVSRSSFSSPVWMIGRSITSMMPPAARRLRSTSGGVTKPIVSAPKHGHAPTIGANVSRSLPKTRTSVGADASDAMLLTGLASARRALLHEAVQHVVRPPAAPLLPQRARDAAVALERLGRLDARRARGRLVAGRAAAVAVRAVAVRGAAHDVEARAEDDVRVARDPLHVEVEHDLAVVLGAVRLDTDDDGGAAPRSKSSSPASPNVESADGRCASRIGCTRFMIVRPVASLSGTQKRSSATLSHSARSTSGSSTHAGSWSPSSWRSSA